MDISYILQCQFDKLSKLIKLHTEDKNIEYLKYILRSYSHYLNKNNLKLSCNIIIHSIICNNCNKILQKEENFTIKLNCGHLICSLACFQNLINNSTDLGILEIDYLFCPNPMCQKQIDKEFIINVFGGPQIYHTLAFDEKKKRGSIRYANCDKCSDNNLLDELITINCQDNHKFCVECLKTHIRSCLENENPKIICELCHEKISPHIYTEILSKDEIEFLSAKKIRRYSSK